MHQTLCALLISATLLTSTQSSNPSDWVGVWQGELDGQPSIVLTLATDDGTLQGTLVLNGISRDGGAPHIALRETHVILHPALTGMALSFDVKRLRGSAGIMNFTVEQTSNQTARIHCLNCGDGAQSSRSQSKTRSGANMRTQILTLLLATLLMPSCLPAQNASQSKFTGVWRGQFDNLPGVDLVLTDEGGQLHGAILFYLHKRADVNAPYTATPGLPEPIFNLRIEGQILHFQVSHRRAHPPASLNDAPKDFQLKLTGPDQAGLTNESGGAPGLTMKRTDY